MKFNAIPFHAALLACALISTGCGGNDGGGLKAPTATIDQATAATLTGRVLFEGTPPPAKLVKVDADPVCAAHATEEKAEVTQEVVVTDGKLANVFVYVSKGVTGIYAPPATAAVLDQQGCRYHPHVLGMVAGQKLQIKNSDPTLHNVHSSARSNEAFNLAQASQGMVAEKTFTTEEVMIPVSCDVHGWMRSYIGVLTHPFFAVTPADGSFTITGLPPGRYTLTAWHERYGEKQQEIEVKAKETKDVSFSYKGS